MKTMNEALQQYHAALSRKQALADRRRDVESQRAQLVRERSTIASAIQKIRGEIQQSTSLDVIKESRRRIADLEKDDGELSGLLGERVLDPARITDELNAVTRDADSRRRIVFTAKLAEILDTDEAKSAKAFMTKMQACLALSGADTPDMTPGMAEVANAQRDLLDWLSNAAQA